MTMNVAMKAALLLTLLVLLSLHEGESARRRGGFSLGRRRSASSSYPKQKQWSSWSSSSSNSGSSYPKQNQWSSWGNTGGSSWGNSGGSSWGNSGSSWNNRGSSGSSWDSSSSTRSRKRWGSSQVATAAIAGVAGLYGGYVLTSMAHNSFGPRYDYNYGYNNYRPYYQNDNCRAGQCEVRFTVNDTVIPPPTDPTAVNVTIPANAELVFLCRNGGTCDRSHVCYNNVYLYNNKLYRDYPRVTAAGTSTSTSTNSQVTAGPSRTTDQVTGPSRTTARNNITAVNVTAVPPVTGNVAKRQAPSPPPEMVQICRATGTAAGTAAFAFLVTMAFFVAIMAP
ncbi:probable ATP-dependent RNA helicase ddx17 [Branchiostoma lanceolatum]|uniref:probable ATP-dependent RNA helicase ddx17 n=1 Tax=Branchiostoma lanceolatum TaxID=7740 RepID=UPI003452D5E0